MFGPRIEGRTGVSLIPPTLEHFNLHARWMMEPEVGRFWGPRFGDVTPERQEERRSNGRLFTRNSLLGSLGSSTSTG